MGIQAAPEVKFALIRQATQRDDRRRIISMDNVVHSDM